MGYLIVASPQCEAAVEGFDGVGAGEEEPVKRVEFGDGGIEGLEGSGVF